MAQFDPREREETRVFIQIGNGAGQKPVYREARYLLVSYDGDPELVVEPANAERFVDFMTNACTVMKPGTHVGRVAGIQFVQGRQFEVHSFDDNVDL